MSVGNTSAAIQAFATHDALVPFLPLVYVAWADGDLEPDEIDAIRARVAALDCVPEEARTRLEMWLDPNKPPTANALAGLLEAMRSSAGALSEPDRLGLKDLGLELARAGGQEVKPSEREALSAIEEALGIASREASQRILRPFIKRAPIDFGEPTFKAQDLQAVLDGPHAELRDRIRTLLAGPEFSYAYGLSKEAYRERVLGWCRRLAEEGIGSLSFPEPCGGQNDTRAFSAAFETIAYHDLSLLIKFGVQFGLYGGAIQQLGTERHHKAHLTDAGTLAVAGCFAMTETGHGSNVADVKTTATYNPATQMFTIHTPDDHARKDYIGNAAKDGRLAVVFAQLETQGHAHGVHAFMVPIRDANGAALPQVWIGDCGEKLGLNGVDNGRLKFDNVTVPRDALLDRFATVHEDGRYESPIASPSRRFFTMLGTLIAGRIGVALGATSAAKSALAIAIRYASRRRQFGPEGQAERAIIDYRTHKRRLFPRLAKAFAIHFALQKLADDFAESIARGGDEDRRELETLAAGLKAYATWNATDTIQACREACGGVGYLAENRFAALKADTDVFTTFEGDNTVLLQLVAKGLLSGYKRQFQEMSFLGMVRFIAGQAGSALAELSPLTARNTDRAHLCDPQFHLATLRYREDDLIATVARRLKKRIDRKESTFDALMACQDHLIAASMAHVERVALEAFRANIDGLPEGPVRTVLDLLSCVYGLTTIEADRGWFLEQGTIAPAKAKAIRKLVNQQLDALRPEVTQLVRAFGIPDALLAAPIAL